DAVRLLAVVQVVAAERQRAEAGAAQADPGVARLHEAAAVVVRREARVELSDRGQAAAEIFGDAEDHARRVIGDTRVAVFTSRTSCVALADLVLIDADLEEA